jgi:predicted nucleotidyltransferase
MSPVFTVAYSICMGTVVDNRQEAVDRINLVAPRLFDLGVRRVALFGSFARGDQRPDSDVDVLVEFISGQKTFDRFVAVCDLLEDTLGRRVEVLTPEALSPFLGPRILREAEDVVVGY